MRYIAIAALLATYLGAGYKHGFQLVTVAYATVGFLAYLAWALDADRGRQPQPARAR